MAQTLLEYNDNYEHFNIQSCQTACVCCLAENVPFIHVITCKHRSFLEYNSKIKIDIPNCVICYLCHGMLKKIDAFTQQIQKSYTILNEKTSQFHKLEPFQYTQVTVLSVEPDELYHSESDKEYQEIGVKDGMDVPLSQKNVLEYRTEPFELTQSNQGNVPTMETDTLCHDNAFTSSKKCIKCQILYDEITLDDLEKHKQDQSSYVCLSCNLGYNHSPLGEENSQKISDNTRLQRNITELHVICPKETCESHTDNNNDHNQYNDNGYNEYENNDYLENDTQSIDKDDISNDITDNHNGSTQKDLTEKKKKKSKKEKTGFKKITLTLEEQKAELEAKRKEKKYLDAEFKCYNCALGFLFKDTYQAHMMRHEESNGEYKCVTCTLRFASPAVLRAHTQLHSTRAQCRRCGARPSPRHTRHHAEKCGGSGAPCHLCARDFSDASGLQQHLKRFHQSKTCLRSYSCSVCGKNYNNQAAVRTHMIKHLNRKFTCDRCPSTFSSPYTLNQHKKKHDAETEVHYCEVCKIGYSSRKSFLAHKRNALVHQQTVSECPICGRVCPNQRALSSHMWVHSAKEHACLTCGARYRSRKSLVRHAATHGAVTHERVHACHRCPSTFKSRSKLNRHLKQVCEKDKLEEELSCYYEQNGV